MALLLRSDFAPTAEAIDSFNRSFIWSSASLIFGVVVTILRLIDFRYTAIKIKGDPVNKVAQWWIQHLRKIGTGSWACLLAQIGTLSVSVWYLLSCLLAVKGSRFGW